MSDSGIGKENLDFRGGKMSGQSAKKSMNHPDPEPIVNVQVWKTGASAFWRFSEGFFWYSTFHRRSQGSQTLLCPKINQADALRFLKLSQSTYSYELILNKG